jgi:hypothetical protein
MGLFVGEGCAKRCNPDVTPAAGEGDGDRIHRAFHDPWDCADSELVVEGAEQLRSLVESRPATASTAGGSLPRACQSPPGSSLSQRSTPGVSDSTAPAGA